APQALGPGNPNTWYFGTNKLYRSINKADQATAVSQLLESGVSISAIAISPQDDYVRIVGLDDGSVFATTKGLTFMVQIAGPGARQTSMWVRMLEFTILLTVVDLGTRTGPASRTQQSLDWRFKTRRELFELLPTAADCTRPRLSP